MTDDKNVLESSAICTVLCDNHNEAYYMFIFALQEKRQKT